ncbi:PD-(D/E)XK nuclease family protein [Thermoactinospora rubra]|uniref:PD-(D/E)XK nuclease family protein n=1 Tax=Thermoactinospora rubra TaxID=1088767 RepID=UPI000A10036C|nr:PD-(D/E)XK nuclease family protein [Thermoactinospora rubra]
MSKLSVPHGVTGTADVVRIGLPLLREEQDACASGRALRARQLLRDERRPRRKPVEDFFFKPVQGMLDAVEHHGQALEAAQRDSRHARNCHPMHAEWAREATSVYLAARAQEEAARVASGHAPTFPVAAEWVSIDRLREPDARGITQYERTVWGRRYATGDGRLREIWIPSIGAANKDRSAVEIAAAAAVTATGVPARAPYRQRYKQLDHDVVRPERVRVVAVGLGDGSVEVLADWDAYEATDRFARLAKPRYAAVVDGRTLRPGSDCLACEGLSACTAIREVPGLLGVPAPARPRKRRSLSASDLRCYESCPARFHLTRTLNIRDGRAENEAIRRGRAVDSWLNERHRRQPRIPCRELPLPASLPGLAGEEAAPALAMLRRHRAHCPLDGLPPDATVRSQWRLAAYDSTADVVVIADPDLLYTERGGWVWRETKTAKTRSWGGRPLLRTYPQLALAVLMMASGVLGGDPRHSRIELELLREDGSACEEIDPFDETTVDQARTVITYLAAGWAADEEYAATPGEHCSECEVQRWCQVRRDDAMEAHR